MNALKGLAVLAGVLLLYMGWSAFRVYRALDQVPAVQQTPPPLAPPAGPSGAPRQEDFACPSPAMRLEFETLTSIDPLHTTFEAWCPANVAAVFARKTFKYRLTNASQVPIAELCAWGDPYFAAVRCEEVLPEADAFLTAEAFWRESGAEGVTWVVTQWRTPEKGPATAAAFRALGLAPTADLLDRVYADRANKGALEKSASSFEEHRASQPFEAWFRKNCERVARCQPNPAP